MVVDWVKIRCLFPGVRVKSAARNKNLVAWWKLASVQKMLDFLGKSSVKVISGDCRKLLPTLEAESFQCCVTSPPYWGLRDYDHESQIGSESSPETYVSNLVEVFRGVRAALKKDGVLWLNVGDGYARNGGTGKCGPNAVVGNTKKMIQKRNCKVPQVWGLKDRDLLGMPWRVAFALQADGWILRSRITWIKRSAMPESVRNRPTVATEDIFLFAKSPNYFYDNNGFREESGANLRNYWVISPDPNGYGHPAAFPREIPKRCILLSTRPDDLVLDPFGGCGTTGVVAQDLGRRSVLIELNPQYASDAKNRGRSGGKKRIKTANP
jgi:site-specific DNA-methyltransferase (cytosine-N4-specific)